MPPKLHYYLRFLLGLTRWEMYGIACLMGLMIGIVGVGEGLSNKEEGLSKKDEGRSKKDERLSKKEEGRRGGLVAEALEASGYDTAFLNEVIRAIKVNKVNKVNRMTRVNSVYGGYWRGSSNWKPRPEALEGRGRFSKPHAIDINTADSLTWIGLKGIGPGFAHRILLFREKLGGFHEVNQLKEVYGLDSLWVKEHKAQLHVGKGIYRKFRLNSLEWSAFRHPYLSYAQAKIVLNYRKQHGPFKDLEALQAVNLFDLKQWKRILPYLAFE